MNEMVGARRRALASCVQLARLAQRMAGNADFARRGRLLLEQRELELGPFAAVPMAHFGDWEADPLRNRSWQWRLNWLSFVSYLIARHAAGGEVQALHLAVDATLSWLDYFGAQERQHPFEFAWHDHATALRAEQMALLVHRIEVLGAWGDCGGDAAASRLVHAIADHAEMLAHDEFFSRHTNHGLEQARVLLLLSTALETPGDPRPVTWRASALARIEGELRHAFTEEGVHVENSPAYHAFVFKVFLGIVDEYPADTLGPLHRWMTEVGPKALDFLARILRPDGLLPIIGDTEALPVTDSFRGVFAGRPEHEAYVYAATLGARGTAPASLQRVYPASGYAIFRSDWPSAEHYRRALHAVIKAGACSHYHRQQDDGSLLLWSEGEDWLIDSGLFNYDKASPVRQYMRSREAHNVLMIDDRVAFDPRSRDPRAAWKVLAHSEDPAMPYLQMRHELYPGIEQLRRVSLYRRRCLRVVDVAVATDGAPFDARVLWHVPLDKKVHLIGPGEAIVSSKRNRRVMRIGVQGDLPDNVELHRGIVKGRVRSVVSNAANSHEPSQVVVFRALSRRRLCLQFDLTFEVT